MKIINVNEEKEELPRLISCPKCLEMMSYRTMESRFNYFNYDKEDKVFFKHVDGIYEEKWYECLECGRRQDAFNLEAFG